GLGVLRQDLGLALRGADLAGGELDVAGATGLALIAGGRARRFLALELRQLRPGGGDVLLRRRLLRRLGRLQLALGRLDLALGGGDRLRLARLALVAARSGGFLALELRQLRLGGGDVLLRRRF